MKKFTLGFVAEYFTILLYSLKFYKILHHRMKTYVGEIDIIATRSRQLVFIEVKARKKGLDEYTISQNQQHRITRSAELFISKNPRYAGYDVRFDLVVIEPYRLPTIIKNAW